MGALAWGMSVGVVGIILVVLFTFVEPQRIAGDWPLGIGQKELDAYATLLDRRMDDTLHAKAERYLLSSPAGMCALEQSGPGWSTHWFEAEGHGDSVEVRRLRTAKGGFVIKFRREEPFRAQRHIVLVPATVESIRLKYLELLAQELGLITPEVSFVRLVACGLDQGIYVKEERIDTDFLEKQGAAGSSLFTQGHDPNRPDHLFPAFEDDTLAGPALRRTLGLAYADIAQGRSGSLPYIVDMDAALGMLLMEWLENEGDPFSQEHLFAYNWAKGRIVPIYRHAREEHQHVTGDARSLDFFTALLKDAEVRKALEARWSRFAEQRWRMKERFAAMDRAWLPILAEGSSLALAQARTQRIQEDLIGDERGQKDVIDALDRSLVRACGAEGFAEQGAATRYWPSVHDTETLARIADRTKARVAGDTLVFLRGRYVISEDLTIPYGYKVVLEQGARFELGPGRSVVVQGPLFVRGTERNPVFVRPAEKGVPFGTFAVVGDGDTRCSIAGLQLSGGSEARLNGVYFSGMFAIHNAGTTLLSDCIISDSHGEDLLNIKGGLVQLDHCIFQDGHADLVDLDGCKGSVSYCTFRSGRKDSNGDGLDVSGARVSVWSCLFSNMMDKGMSVGEASQVLVRASRFQGNRLALASKDLSIAYAQDNTFVDNGIVFGAYRKKPIYGGARVMRGANEYVGNGREQEVDELSAVVQQELDAKTLKAFGVE